MIIDAAYLNFVINDLKKYFEPRLGRQLKKADLALLTICLAMDAGLKPGQNEVQILLVYDEKTSSLPDCVPSDLQKELDGVAFNSPFGEFSFLSVPSEGYVSLRDLYLDLFQIVLNSGDVKKLIAVPFCEEYGEDVNGIIREYTSGNPESGKEIIQFLMERPAVTAGYRCELLGYPLLTALGIKSVDLSNN